MKNTRTAQENTPPRGFRPHQIAVALGIPRSSVYGLIRRGELTAVRYGRHGLVVLEQDLLRFLANHRTSTAGLSGP